jgi:hypothetical protein
MAHTDLANVWQKPQSFRGADHYGIRLNNLTTTERDALTGSGAPFAGAVIWNTTTSAVEFYDGSNWLILPNNLDATEFGFVNGVTAGQFPAASKAVVAGSDGYVPHRIHILADAASPGLILTSADSGGLVVMDKTDGSLTTLPELTASTLGMTFEFQWPASYASGDQKIITGNAADFIVGTIRMFDTDTLTDPLSVVTFNGTDHIAVLINAVTDGGLLGSWLRFTAISATQWLIQGVLHHSGGVSSPVSTT